LQPATPREQGIVARYFDTSHRDHSRQLREVDAQTVACSSLDVSDHPR
jgi:hypothetical protein